MKNISAILRKNIPTLSKQLARGAKKKKQATVVAPTSNQIINIFKNRKDPVPLPNQMYPPWLFEILQEQKYSYIERNRQMNYGHYIPTGRQKTTYIRATKKTIIKRGNRDRIERKEGDSDQSDIDYTPFYGATQREMLQYKEDQDSGPSKSLEDMDITDIDLISHDAERDELERQELEAEIAAEEQSKQ